MSSYAGRCFSFGDTVSLKSAPDWVNWIAQDADGAWWGFEVEPLQADRYWYENEVGRYIALGRGAANPNWRESLRRATAPQRAQDKP